MMSEAKPVAFESKWQESVPDVAWGTLLLALGIVLGYYWTISSALAGDLPYAAATLICAYLAYASFTVVHDAGHGSIVKSNARLKPIESMLGWAFAVPLLLVPYRFFQKIHDRHHSFTNDPDRDPDHYTFAHSWFTVALNSLYIPIQYHVLAFTKLRGVRAIRSTYKSTACYFTAVVSGLLILTALGYGFEIVAFVIIPNIIAVLALALFFDYIPHHPHKSRSRYHDTRIYPGTLLNVLLLGQNYHLIHHMYPRLPWYKYKEVYTRILPDLEVLGAPIEDLRGGTRPGFMTSPNTRSLLDDGKSINMVLEVAKVRALTFDSACIEFKLPQGERLQYQAGQYITVSKWLNGEQQTRCYSLCAKPGSDSLKIGVRRTAQGLVSGFLNDDLKVGDELVVQGPFGDFVYPAAEPNEHDGLVLIAGGSGITPILSIAETALAEHPNVSVTLIYACRSRDSIMFFDQLEHLKEQHPERLTIRYVIHQELHDPLDIQGRLNKATLAELLPSRGADSSSAQTKRTAFYICGPAGLKDLALDVLAERNIAREQIHIEQFVSSLTEAKGPLHKVDVALADGQTHSLSVASNQTVLEVAKAARIQLPHACSSGTCGSCKLKIEEGEAVSIPNSVPGITSDEKSAGYTLACQCKPLNHLVLSES
ncbi:MULTISPECIES: fatty acid desaturase [unclassified Oleiphilus]|nr:MULTISPECIES: fatty acid desaturase [unclassified Oleiphilus]